MADPIKTTSGRTPKARIAALRAQRVPSVEEQRAMALDTLEALGHLLYEDLRASRERQNALRVKVVEALQLVRDLRKLRVDVEI